MQWMFYQPERMGVSHHLNNYTMVEQLFNY